MPSCVAVGCTNRPGKKISGISFHKFPAKIGLRKAWIVACRRKNWVPTKCSSLCSSHFSEDQIDRTSKSIVRLRENAVPNIFEAFPSYFQNKTALTVKVRPAYEGNLKCFQETGNTLDDIESDVELSEESDNTEDSIDESGNALESMDERNALEFIDASENAVESIDESDNTVESIDESDNAVESINESENAVESIDESDNSVDSIDESENEDSVDEGVNAEYVDENVNTAINIKGEQNSEKIATETENTQNKLVEFTQTVPTVIYRVIDASTESKGYLEKQLKSIEEENNKYRKQIRTVQQKYRRLNKKIAKMESFVNNYRLNHVLSDASLKILNGLPALDNELLILQLSEESLQLYENISSQYNSADHFSDTDIVVCSSDNNSS